MGGKCPANAVVYIREQVAGPLAPKEHTVQAATWEKTKTMKHFMDYNPTSAEIEALFGLPNHQEAIEYIKFIEGTDSELLEIAGLLASRGEDEGAVKTIESIGDDEYREVARLIVLSWINLPPGAV